MFAVYYILWYIKFSLPKLIFISPQRQENPGKQIYHMLIYQSPDIHTLSLPPAPQEGILPTPSNVPQQASLPLPPH